MLALQLPDDSPAAMLAGAGWEDVTESGRMLTPCVHGVGSASRAPAQWVQSEARDDVADRLLST